MRLALPVALLVLLFGCVPASGPGPDPQDTGITGDPGEWVFHPIDGMVCGGGDATGIGINEGSDPEAMVVIMAGGGACWDAGSCFVINAAANLEVAWGEAHLANETAGISGTGLLERGGDGPLDAATWVYVPYCTGDLHAGNAERVHNAFEPNRVTHHKGDANLVALLDRLTTDYPDVAELRVIGISAGGYGAQIQADRFADAWPEANLGIFADGSPMVQPLDGRYTAWRQAWDLRVPENCADCTTRFTSIVETRAAELPDASFALATYGDDEVIQTYFNYPPGWLAGAQQTLIDETYAEDNLSVFAMSGTVHTMLGTPDAHVAEGISVRDWFETWAAGEPLDDVGEL